MASPADKNELVTAFLDRELEGEQAAEMEAFLASSAEARQEVDDLRRMLQVVSRLSDVKAPADFYEKLAPKLRRRPWPRDATVLFSLPMQVLSILVILAVAAAYMLLELDRERVRLEKEPEAPSPAEPARPLD